MSVQIRDRSGDLMEMLNRWIEQADNSIETMSQNVYEGAREREERARYKGKVLRSLQETFRRVLADQDAEPLGRVPGDL